MTHPLCPPHQACWTRTLVGRRPFPCRLPQSTVHVEAATVKEEEQPKLEKQKSVLERVLEPFQLIQNNMCVSTRQKMLSAAAIG